MNASQKRGGSCGGEHEYRFYTIEQISEITGLGRDTMTALISLGAPTVARKMNLPWFLEWLKQNPEIVRDLKVRG